MAPDHGLDFDNEVHIGYRVVGVDGEELGHVGDAMQLYFKVEGGPDGEYNGRIRPKTGRRGIGKDESDGASAMSGSEPDAKADAPV